MIGGLLIVMPILITLWVFYWLYSNLEKKVIDPIALLVLWKVRQGQADVELPYWFETYAAPVIAIFLVLVLLYVLGFFVQSRLRRAVDWVLLRVPVMSGVYDGVRNVFQSLERKSGKQAPQRVVLIPFPHPGMKAAAFVTATCKDIETQKTLLVVYVPQSPLPTNGHLLLGSRRRDDGIELGSGRNPANAHLGRLHCTAGRNLLRNRMLPSEQVLRQHLSQAKPQLTSSRIDHRDWR